MLWFLEPSGHWSWIWVIIDRIHKRLYVQILFVCVFMVMFSLKVTNGYYIVRNLDLKWINLKHGHNFKVMDGFFFFLLLLFQTCFIPFRGIWVLYFRDISGGWRSSEECIAPHFHVWTSLEWAFTWPMPHATWRQTCSTWRCCCFPVVGWRTWKWPHTLASLL